MATITINIPVDKEDWVLDGLAVSFNYQTDIPNPLFDDQLPEDPIENPLTIPNPVTKAGHAKAGIIEVIKDRATQGHITNHWVSEGLNKDSVILT
jgi:hypothetical protein